MELVLLWLLFGIAGAAVLSRANKAGIGCLLGIILGPIGLIIAWVVRRDWEADKAAAAAKKKNDAKRKAARNREYAERDAERERTRTQRECPHCAELILKKAKVCKHCGRDVEPIA